MRLDFARYRYTRRAPRNAAGGILLLVIAVAAGVALLVAVVRPRLEGTPQRGFTDLLGGGQYDELVNRTEAILARHPLDAEALLFRGVAYFYKSVGVTALEDKLPFIDEAIFSLRRALLDGALRTVGQADYVLGKAYYHKGTYYYDLAARYLESSVSKGYVGADTYEYLGLVYTQMDDPKGLDYFLRALEERPTDLLHLNVAEHYWDQGNTAEAELHFVAAVETTVDPTVGKRSRMLLAEMYRAVGRHSDAINQYEAILVFDPADADVHFFLGEVYAALNDIVRARAEWRLARVIDPEHHGAGLRLGI